jgi:hypothetical protein
VITRRRIAQIRRLISAIATGKRSRNTLFIKK